MTVQGVAVLQSLLGELASVLLPRGMTPKRFSQLAEYAFVQAAAGTTKLRNGRVNHSRVAVQTGLTRAEVKRLLNSNILVPNHAGETALERVIHGWRTDREFAISAGRSKALQIVGPRGSFARLVKKYGGDVPHRAVLDELRRIGAVRDFAGTVQLRRSLNIQGRNNYKFLSPVLPVLIDVLRVASKWDASNISPVQRLAIPAATETDLTSMREHCASAARSMLDGLADTFGLQVGVSGKASGKARPPSHVFSITVLQLDNRAKESTVRSRPLKRSVQD